MGRLDEAHDVLERWRRAAEASHQSLFSLGHQWVEALVCAGRGEYQRALTLLEQALATAERVDDFYLRTRVPNTIGWVYVELEHHELALEWSTRGVEVAQQVGALDAECEYNARLNLADTLMALGRLDEAEQQFRIVEQVVRAPRPQEHWMLWRYAQHHFHSYGELWLMRGATEQALAYADECLQLAEGSESHKNIVKARRLRGQIFLAEGKLEAADAELAAALETASEVGNPPQLWKTLVALGDLRQAQGRLDAAQAAYRDALATIDSVANHLTDTSLRETLLSSPHVERIRHLLREAERRGASPAQVQ
jgi:tetratricopeptide (TPR) repeat protein